MISLNACHLAFLPVKELLTVFYYFLIFAILHTARSHDSNAAAVDGTDDVAASSVKGNATH